MRWVFIVCGVEGRHTFDKLYSPIFCREIRVVFYSYWLKRKICWISLSTLTWRSGVLLILWMLPSILTWRSMIVWGVINFGIQRAMCAQPGGGCTWVVGFQLNTVWISREEVHRHGGSRVFSSASVVGFEFMTVWILLTEVSSYGSSECWESV